jgi:CheY-like chemotaxis protein
MSVKIANQTYYRSAEVYRMVGISRATLFRWLKQGVLGKAEYRDRRGWRLFAEEDVAKLKAEASRVTVNSSKLLPKQKEMVLHILVVDDDPLIGGLFKSSLESHGYQVTTALSGKDGLKLAAEKRFDLIFLDLVMPELDGAELFRRIRAIDKSVPITIITGYPDSGLMAKAMEQGPFMVMKKPFSTEQILQIVSSQGNE